MAVRKGSKVSWKWGRSTAEGKVTAVHRDTVTRTSKGTKVTRNASKDEPAYEIEQEDGTTVLKSASEVDTA
jgi:Hypervirulence associated proteins TUDOR domain